MYSGRNGISSKFSSIIFLLSLILLIITVIVRLSACANGTSAYLFGYRPLLVVSNSMEPYMLTHSLVISKQVTSLEELAVGDVISFTLTLPNGETVLNTHRIICIIDGVIQTKGDNVVHADNYALTLSDIEGKVVAVCNLPGHLSRLWQSPLGKLLCISIGVGIIFLCKHSD